MTQLRLHRAGALGAVLVGWVAAAGCFSTPPQDEFYYYLSGPTATYERGRGPRLAISEFTSTPGYDSQRLAYRVAEHELRYWGYRRWVSEPPRMLAEMTMKHLRATHLFGEVGMGDRVKDPHGLLEAHVVAIEEVDDEEQERWYARLAIHFTLREEGSGKVLFKHGFDTTRPCEKRDPRDVARVVSEILADEVRRLGRRVHGALRGAAFAGPRPHRGNPASAPVD